MSNGGTAASTTRWCAPAPGRCGPITVAPAPATASTAAPAPIRCQGRCLPMVACLLIPRSWRTAAQARAAAAKPAPWSAASAGCGAPNRIDSATTTAGARGGQQHGGGAAGERVPGDPAEHAEQVGQHEQAGGPADRPGGGQQLLPPGHRGAR